jgi:hypothetical protein
MGLRVKGNTESRIGMIDLLLKYNYKHYNGLHLEFRPCDENSEHSNERCFRQETR